MPGMGIMSYGYISSPVQSTGGSGAVFRMAYPPTSQIAGTWSVFTDDGILNKQLYNSTNAQNNEVNYSMFIPAGVYTLYLVFKKSSEGAIATVTIDGVSQGTIDTYAAAPAYAQSGTIAGITISTSGIKSLNFKAATRHASSTGYYLEFEYFFLEKTA